MPSFARRTEIPVVAEDVRAWHARQGAAERLMPPWQSVEAVRRDQLGEDDHAVLRIGNRFLFTRWEIEQRGNRPGERLTDVHVAGPFTHWDHTHTVAPHDIDSRLSVVEDHVDYELPIARLVQPLARRTAEREVVRLFAYRHRVMGEDLVRHEESELGPLTIAITGSTGLIGSALTPFLTAAGHTVLRIVRSRATQVALSGAPNERTIYWRPSKGYIDAGALEGVDAVVHLAGEPMFGRRWSRRQRASILDSRARGTRLLAETMAGMARPPRVLLSASAYRYYGDRGQEVMSEASEPGDGFLPDVCRAWEQATGPARRGGIRVCHLRFGPVLSPRGGLLRGVMPAFRLGLGGTFGRGDGWIPWICIDDALYGVLHLLARDDLYGPYNVCAPHPATRKKLSNDLAYVLGRSAHTRLPRAVVALAAGPAARQVTGASVRAVPERLANSGFRFAYPHLTDALQHLLGRTPAPSLATDAP